MKSSSPWYSALGALALTVGCATSPLPPTSPASAPEVPRVQNRTDARAHAGVRVQVRGALRRAKLGDMLQSAALTVHCTNRLPDHLLEQTVTVEGELFEQDTGATEGPRGALSQGTPPGTRSWMLEACELIAPDASSASVPRP